MLKLVRRPGQAAWYLRGTVNGRRYDESTKVAEKALADAIRVQREAELQREAVFGKQATATFAQAAVHYIEHGGNGRFLEPVLLRLGRMLLSSIGQLEMDACAKALYPNASGSTRNRQVYSPISAVMHHAAGLGWCPRPAIKRPKPAPPAQRWLTKDEADRLLAALAPHLKRLVLFLLYTGARVGEALWLDWKDVDLDRKHVQFIDTKNGTSRGVPLHERIIDDLRGVNERSGCVFRTDDGSEYTRPKPNQDADTSAGSRIKTGFRAAVRRAGLAELRPHDLRHTWATWHYQANRDLGALMRLGGWKTMSMVMRYAHVNVAELGPTIDRL